MMMATTDPLDISLARRQRCGTAARLRSLGDAQHARAPQAQSGNLWAAVAGVLRGLAKRNRATNLFGVTPMACIPGLMACVRVGSGLFQEVKRSRGKDPSRRVEGYIIRRGTDSRVAPRSIALDEVSHGNSR